MGGLTSAACSWRTIPTTTNGKLFMRDWSPAARGRGFGVALTRHAQWQTGVAGRARLVLAVDAANRPAIAAYSSAGFVVWDRRCALLRIFDPPQSAQQTDAK